jgi:hypothetical protein
VAVLRVGVNAVPVSILLGFVAHPSESPLRDEEGVWVFADPAAVLVGLEEDFERCSAASVLSACNCCNRSLSLSFFFCCKSY